MGLEALVRWQHPSRGIVMPGAFIPVLERNNFIASLDLYVWEKRAAISVHGSIAAVCPFPYR